MEEIDEDGDVEVTEVVSDVSMKDVMASNPFASGHNPFANFGPTFGHSSLPGGENEASDPEIQPFGGIGAMGGFGGFGFGSSNPFGSFGPPESSYKPNPRSSRARQ